MVHDEADPNISFCRSLSSQTAPQLGSHAIKGMPCSAEAMDDVPLIADCSDV